MDSVDFNITRTPHSNLSLFRFWNSNYSYYSFILADPPFFSPVVKLHGCQRSLRLSLVASLFCHPTSSHEGRVHIADLCNKTEKCLVA